MFRRHLCQWVSGLHRNKKKGNMEPREKRILDKKLKDFMMDVVPVDLLPYLPCLTRFDKEEIEASQRNHGPTRACCVLVDRLKKRQRGFQQFLQALRQSGSHHVVLLLDPNFCTSHEGEINIPLEMQNEQTILRITPQECLICKKITKFSGRSMVL